jgi:adenosyl cobinamide kinase/adenosyl cobinamide phosphate guanylyltransferase
VTELVVERADDRTPNRKALNALATIGEKIDELMAELVKARNEAARSKAAEEEAEEELAEEEQFSAEASATSQRDYEEMIEELERHAKSRDQKYKRLEEGKAVEYALEIQIIKREAADEVLKIKQVMDITNQDAAAKVLKVKQEAAKEVAAGLKDELQAAEDQFRRRTSCLGWPMLNLANSKTRSKLNATGGRSMGYSRNERRCSGIWSGRFGQSWSRNVKRCGKPWRRSGSARSAKMLTRTHCSIVATARAPTARQSCRSAIFAERPSHSVTRYFDGLISPLYTTLSCCRESRSNSQDLVRNTPTKSN